MIFIGNTINWKLISKAISYYQKCGFEYIEVPWEVSNDAIKSTFKDSTLKNDHNLVGSAEQSFAQMMIDGKLKHGKYVAATPCFRNENDSLHQPYFFKVELIDFNPIYITTEMINCAFSFFDKNTSKKDKLEKVKTNIGYDIMLNGIEIGSYGWRNFKHEKQYFMWIYGTGLAEPRFSMALKNYDI